MTVDVRCITNLRNLSAIHYPDSVRHDQRLFLVMGNHKSRYPLLKLDAADLFAELNTHLGIQCRQGLVEQQDFRLNSQCTCESHALLLPA